MLVVYLLLFTPKKIVQRFSVLTKILIYQPTYRSVHESRYLRGNTEIHSAIETKNLQDITFEEDIIGNFCRHQVKSHFQLSWKYAELLYAVKYIFGQWLNG